MLTIEWRCFTYTVVPMLQWIQAFFIPTFEAQDPPLPLQKPGSTVQPCPKPYAYLRPSKVYRCSSPKEAIGFRASPRDRTMFELKAVYKNYDIILNPRLNLQPSSLTIPAHVDAKNVGRGILA